MPSNFHDKYTVHGIGAYRKASPSGGGVSPSGGLVARASAMAKQSRSLPQTSAQRKAAAAADVKAAALWKSDPKAAKKAANARKRARRGATSVIGGKLQDKDEKPVGTGLIR